MFAGGDGSTLSLDFTTMSGLDSRFTFTRASNATFINAAGLVEWAQANWMTQSNAFTTSPWSATNVTMTTDGQSPVDVAWRMTEANTPNLHRLDPSSVTCPNAQVSISVYVKQGSGTRHAYLRVSDNFSGEVSSKRLDPVNGTLLGAEQVGGSWTSANTSVVNVGNGWYRLVLTANKNAGSGVICRVGMCDSNGNLSYSGDGSSYLLFSGVQVNPGPAQPYIATTGSAYQAPRFDHDPSTLAPKGLLLESSTTNLLEYSETFASLWVLTDLQRSTTESTTAPDGTTVFAIETTSGTTARNFLRTAGVVNETAVTFSYWFKPGNVTDNETSATNQSAGRIFGIYKTNATAGMIYSIRIDGQDPTAFQVQVGTGTYEAVAYPNGWYRCRLTTTITTGDSIRVYLGSTGGQAVDSLYWYVWGAQLETGSGASSYIPTGAGTVQRAADVCEFPFDPATYGYNTDPNHTFALGWNIGVGTTSGFPGLFDIRDVGGNRCHGFTINNAANPTHFSQAGVTAGSVTTVGLTNRPIGVNRKLAASVIDGATGHNFSIDGVAGTPQAVTSAVLRVPTRVGSPGVQIPSATLQFVKFYPFAMTSAQLNAITS